MSIFRRLQKMPWMHLHQTMQLRNNELQFEELALLTLQKTYRQRRLRDLFSNKDDFKLYITDCHLRTLHLPQTSLVSEERLPLKEILQSANNLRIPELDGNIVILNNSDIDSMERMDMYSNFYDAHPDTIFIGWDNDNHHALHVSMAFASLVDFYVQAHPENFYDLSRFNSLRAYIPLGVSYITRIDALKLWPKINTAQRTNETRGIFENYNLFTWRNKIIQTLSNTQKKVGFFNEVTIKGSLEDYFENLIAHKLHWIVPTLNDVSGRIFETLLAGGIPLIPDSLRFHPAIVDLDSNHFIYYALDDVVTPESFLRESLFKFDKLGEIGVRTRFECAMNNHADVRLIRILKMGASYFKYIYI